MIVKLSMVMGLFIGVVVYRKMLYEEKLKKSGIKDIDEMDGRQIEHYISEVQERNRSFS